MFNNNYQHARERYVYDFDDKTCTAYDTSSQKAKGNKSTKKQSFDVSSAYGIQNSPRLTKRRHAFGQLKPEHLSLRSQRSRRSINGIHGLYGRVAGKFNPCAQDQDEKYDVIPQHAFLNENKGCSAPSTDYKQRKCESVHEDYHTDFDEWNKYIYSDQDVDVLANTSNFRLSGGGDRGWNQGMQASLLNGTHRFYDHVPKIDDGLTGRRSDYASAISGPRKEFKNHVQGNGVCDLRPSFKRPQRSYEKARGEDVNERHYASGTPRETKLESGKCVHGNSSGSKWPFHHPYPPLSLADKPRVYPLPDHAANCGAKQGLSNNAHLSSVTNGSTKQFLQNDATGVGSGLIYERMSSDCWRQLWYTSLMHGLDTEQLAFKILQELVLSPTTGLPITPLHHISRALSAVPQTESNGHATVSFTDLPRELLATLPALSLSRPRGTDPSTHFYGLVTSTSGPGVAEGPGNDCRGTALRFPRIGNGIGDRRSKSFIGRQRFVRFWGRRWQAKRTA